MKKTLSSVTSVSIFGGVVGAIALFFFFQKNENDGTSDHVSHERFVKPSLKSERVERSHVKRDHENENGSAVAADQIGFIGGGEVTGSMRLTLGISDEQAFAIKDAYLEAKTKVESMMLSRMRRDPVYDDVDTGTIGYRIDSFETEAGQLENEYRRSLESKKIPMVDAFLESYKNDTRMLGGGRFDVVLRISPGVSGGENGERLPNDSWNIVYEMYNVETAKRYAFGNRRLKEFNLQFMRLFDLGGN